MRTAFLVVSSACLAAALLSGPRGVAAEPAEGPAALFQASCAACHAIPDLGLPMDLAWLDQVNRTT